MSIKILDRVKLDFSYSQDASEEERLTEKIVALSWAIFEAHEERSRIINKAETDAPV